MECVGLPAEHANYYRILGEYRQCRQECRTNIERLRAAEQNLSDYSIPAGAPRFYLTAEDETVLRANMIALLPGLSELSERELEVFRLMGAGYAAQEIAQHLQIACSTVHVYKDRMKRKLKLDSGAALTRCAILHAALNL